MNLYPQMELAVYAGGSFVVPSFVSLGGFFDLPFQDGASSQSPVFLQFELIFLGQLAKRLFFFSPLGVRGWEGYYSIMKHSLTERHKNKKLNLNFLRKQKLNVSCMLQLLFGWSRKCKRTTFQKQMGPMKQLFEYLQEQIRGTRAISYTLSINEILRIF